MIGSAFRSQASPHKPPPLSRPHNGDSVLYHSLLGFGKRRESSWRLPEMATIAPVDRHLPEAGLNEVASAFGSGHRWYVCDIL